MKKLWDSYSYAIILVVLSILTSFIIIVQVDTTEDEKFLKVTVAEGDSLWEIAESFSEEHKLTSNEFVKWVEDNNGITGGRIFPGDELVIPVEKEIGQHPTELASSR